jgi:leucyl-tRNA synthetase
LAEVDEQALKADVLELVLQVNGKVRGAIRVAADADKVTIESAARDHDAVAKHLDRRAPKRIIVVPGKLVNVVG